MDLKNTVILAQTSEHAKRIIEFFRANGVNTKNIIGRRCVNTHGLNGLAYYGIVDGIFSVWTKAHLEGVKIIQLPEDIEVKEPEEVKKSIKISELPTVKFVYRDHNGNVIDNRALEYDLLGYVTNQKPFFMDEVVDKEISPNVDKTPGYYDNSKGSLYQFAEEQGLNAYEFDIVKRIVRSRKKGNFIEDLEKTKTLIDLYLFEYEGNQKM